MRIKASALYDFPLRNRTLFSVELRHLASNRSLDHKFRPYFFTLFVHHI